MMDGAEAMWGAAASAAVTGVLALARYWLRCRAKAARQSAALELVRAGLRPDEIRDVMRAADDSGTES